MSINKETLKRDYMFIFTTMLREGILSLEDYLKFAEKIPGFSYTLSALIDGYSTKTCLKMYKAFKNEIENYEVYYKLVKFFYKKTDIYFDAIYNKKGRPINRRTVAQIEKEIENYVDKILVP